MKFLIVYAIFLLATVLGYSGGIRFLNSYKRSLFIFGLSGQTFIFLILLYYLYLGELK